MRIFNTYTRQKEELAPLQPGLVRMYSCGPTVYRYIHIGNLRTFSMADWLRRALMHQGMEVQQIKNITDVGHMRVERLDAGEDKLLAQARKEQRSATEVAAFYTAAFHEDERRMNILPADRYPRASQHVDEMIALIGELERNGLAYAVGGNVYYDVKRFASYGALSGNQFDGLRAGVQENAGDAKRNAEDFPLWKQAEPGREMAWDSPWGRGFPGWHIECSAMSMRYLGRQFDLHTGGVDNIFPHHENEIAQSEGATGQRWVSCWVHAQHLLTDGLKMAKSTGNDYTLDEIIARGFEPLALRYLFTTAHYRSRLNFTFTALLAAQTALRRLRAAAQALPEADPATLDAAQLTIWRQRFDAALDDDLNLPRALAVVWALVRRGGATGPAERRALLAEWDQVLGLDLFHGAQSGQAATLPPTLAEQLAERTLARARQDYARADALRAEIVAAGFELRDRPDGTEVLPQALGRRFPQLTSWHSAPDRSAEPDRFEWSINLIARNNCDDLQRSLQSIVAHAGGRSIELVIIDNGSTDDTLGYLQQLAQHAQLDLPDGGALPVEVLFADHNLGFAGGRNATIQASSGRYIALLDTSIELSGEVWSALAAALADRDVGVAGPYGLVTDDLREFREAPGPDVDAIEGYLLAFRRDLFAQVGPIDEKFRFYRLADIYLSFFIKAAGLRAVALTEVAAQLIKHPHREYYSLSPEERETKSKRNYDLFRRRWHHGESLLVRNAAATERWPSHNDPRHLLATHTHPPEELPPPGQPHSHVHRHLPDHEHSHPHYHDRASDRTSDADATLVLS